MCDIIHDMKKLKSHYFSAFWGMRPERIKATVIISPIIFPQQFAKVINEKAPIQKALWGNLVTNLKKCTFIKTPMLQSAVADAMALLAKTKCIEIIFLGAIGALSDRIRIGDVVVTNKSKQIHSMNSVHEETQSKMQALEKKGVVGIDFESRAFFSAAKKNGISALAYYIVTDLPLTKPFYLKRTKVENNRIQDAVVKVIRQIYSDIDARAN